MKLTAAFLALPLLFGGAVLQGQVPAEPTQTEAPGSPGAPTAERIYGPKDGVKPPRLTYSPEPKYPKNVRKAHKEGTVVVWVIVGSDGLTRSAKVARGLSPEFDQSALDAVSRWKFEPATKDGKPVSVQINVEVNFKLGW